MINFDGKGAVIRRVYGKAGKREKTAKVFFWSVSRKQGETEDECTEAPVSTMFSEGHRHEQKKEGRAAYMTRIYIKEKRAREKSLQGIFILPRGCGIIV